MPSKPTIANLEWEFDARTLTLSDGDTVVTWEDQSGQGNDATGVGTPHYEALGWRGDLPAVRLTELPSVERFDLDGTGFVGTDMTFFAVVDAIDISGHLAIIGSPTSATPPRRANLWIRSNGSVIFTFQFDPHDVQSAVGIVSSGDQILITARHSSSSGKIIRVNRIQVGASPSRTQDLVEYAGASLGVIKDDIVGGAGTQYGVDKRFAWISGYHTAASDQEILDMEAYLYSIFFKTAWASCAPDPGTVWTSCN
jgi:hypothetical protein